MIEIDDPQVGKITTPGFPIKFSVAPGRIERGVPKLSQHTGEVLSRFLKYSEEEVAKLREEKVI